MKKFNYYIGIDVSKLTLDITILYECVNVQKTEYYKIENSEKRIIQFVKNKLGNYDLKQVLFCFEDTGIYSMPLSYYLSDNELTYWQVPSVEIKRSKGIARGKDDKIDSKDIAFYAYTHTHKLRQGKVSDKSIQQLKILFTEREKVLKALASFEKTSENKGFISKDVFNAVAAVNKQLINQLKKTLKNIEEKMMAIIGSEEKLDGQYKLVTSIPGVGMQTAIYLLVATKGFDAFENWRQLACYSGVAPFPYQSGTSIRGRNKVHPLADKKLKSLLNICAICAVRHDRELKAYYERMNKKLTKNKAYAQKMSRLRSSTLEPVLGTLINFLNMKRVNTRGRDLANKHVLMSALTYNLKKYLKFVNKKLTANAIAMQIEVKSDFFGKFSLFKLIVFDLNPWFREMKISNKKIITS